VIPEIKIFSKGLNVGIKVLKDVSKILMIILITSY